MKLYSLITSLLFFTHIASASIDLNQKYDCTVTKAIHAGTASTELGAKTTQSITMNSIKEGFIHLDTGAIDFYGSLKAYDYYAPGSGLIVFSTDTQQLKEIQGSIMINEVEKAPHSLELQVSIFNTTRVFDPITEQSFFALQSAPEMYTLQCEKAL